MSARVATREARGNPRTMVALLLAPVVAGLGFVLGVVVGVQDDDLAMLALALLTATIGFVPLIIDQRRAPEQRHLVLSLFSLIFMTYLVVPVFTYYLPGSEPKSPPGMRWAVLQPADVVAGQQVALLGLVAMLVGYATPLGRLLGSIVPAPKRDWTAGQTIAVGLGLILAGWFVSLSAMLGLIPSEFGGGVLGVIAQGTIYGIALIAIPYLRTGSPAALLLLAIWVPLTMSFNFFTGSKKAFLSPPAMVVVAAILVRGRIRARWIALGVLALTLLYPTSQFYRDVVLAGYTRTALQALQSPGAVIDSLSQFLAYQEPGAYFEAGFQAVGARLDGLGRASLIIRETPRSVPFQGGWTIGYIFLAYVPRIFWPGKPSISIGQWVTEAYGSGTKIQSSTGPTWIGEFYLNFGIPGVLGGMLVVGLLLRIAHEVLFRRTRTVPGMLIAGILLFGLTTTIGGGLVGGFNRVIFAAGFLLILHFALGIFTPRRRTTGQWEARRAEHPPPTPSVSTETPGLR